MISIDKQGGELVGTQDGLGSSDHVLHGFGVVVVGYFEVNGDVMPGIGGGLDDCPERSRRVVGHFGDVVSNDHLSAVRIGGGDLLLIAAIEMLMQGFVFSLSGSLLFDFGLEGFLLLAVSVFFGEFGLVFGQFFFDLGQIPFDFLGVEVGCPPQEGSSCCSGPKLGAVLIKNIPEGNAPSLNIDCPA